MMEKARENASLVTKIRLGKVTVIGKVFIRHLNN